MIRKHKSYVKPKKAYEVVRMKEENVLVEKYGLKNKREVWKSIAKLNYFRRRAKALAKSSSEEQEVLFKKLQALGLKTESIADVLALSVEDILERRFATLVAKKGFANTARHARQLIVHKKILINGKVVNSPGRLITLKEESSFFLVKKEPKKHVEEKKTEEVTNG